MSVDRETFIDFAALAVITGQVSLSGRAEPEKAYEVAGEIWQARKKALGVVEVELRNGMPVGDVERFTTGFDNATEDSEAFANRVKLEGVRAVLKDVHPSAIRRALDDIRKIVES